MAHDLVHDPHSRMVRIDAIPKPITLDPTRTAVLVVDMPHHAGALRAVDGS